MDKQNAAKVLTEFMWSSEGNYLQLEKAISFPNLKLKIDQTIVLEYLMKFQDYIDAKQINKQLNVQGIDTTKQP